MVFFPPVENILPGLSTTSDFNTGATGMSVNYDNSHVLLDLSSREDFTRPHEPEEFEIRQSTDQPEPVSMPF